MSAKENDTKQHWVDPDDAPEWSADVFGRAQIAVGGKVIREATGTLTKRGRPPLGAEAKQQVTLRLPKEVIAHFKAEGPGWQSRISDALEKIARRRRADKEKAA